MHLARSRVYLAGALVLVLGVWASVAHAENYYIYNVPGSGTYVSSSSYGTWKAARGAYGEAALISTASGTTKPDWATTQTVQFEFTTQNYLSVPGQGGHLATFVRGDIYTVNPWNPNYPYRGHGVVVGNVSEYPSSYNPAVGYEWLCSPTSNVSTVAVEVAGSGYSYDNCVFGSATSAPVVLSDNVTYWISISSTFSSQTGRNTTTYSLYRKDGIYWTYLYSKQISYYYDYQTIGSRLLGGWFIAEMGRGVNSSWSLSIQNLTSYWQ